MQLHELQPKHKNRNKKRVGRGGRKGTTSGRGSKGQKSRAGRKMVPIIRELIKRYPKLKGYRSFAIENFFALVSLESLEKNTVDGEIVNPENLIKKGLVDTVKGKTPKVKILGAHPKAAPFTKKIIVENCKISKTAKEAIEKAGGSIK